MGKLQAGQPLSILRSYFDGIHGDMKLYSLYGFCDASLSADAAVWQTDVGRLVKFVVSKMRVVPLQSQTIPRLELLSARTSSGQVDLQCQRLFKLSAPASSNETLH